MGHKKTVSVFLVSQWANGTQENRVSVYFCQATGQWDTRQDNECIFCQSMGQCNMAPESVCIFCQSMGQYDLAQNTNTQKLLKTAFCFLVDFLLCKRIFERVGGTPFLAERVGGLNSDLRPNIVHRPYRTLHCGSNMPN
jgi:hypothetical protein